MTPPAAPATVRARRVTRETQPPSTRPSLRLLARGDRRARVRRRALARPLAVALLVGALVAVVVAQTMLASDQVRLTNVSAQLSAEQSKHQQLEITVNGQEAPQRIAAAAARDGSNLQNAPMQLPYVSLRTPLAAPNVTPAPTTATTTQPATGQ